MPTVASVTTRTASHNQYPGPHNEGTRPASSPATARLAPSKRASQGVEASCRPEVYQDSCQIACRQESCDDNHLSAAGHFRSRDCAAPLRRPRLAHYRIAPSCSRRQRCSVLWLLEPVTEPTPPEATDAARRTLGTRSQGSMQTPIAVTPHVGDSDSCRPSLTSTTPDRLRSFAPYT